MSIRIAEKKDLIELLEIAAQTERLLPKPGPQSYKSAISRMIAPTIGENDEPKPFVTKSDYDVWLFINFEVLPSMPQGRTRQIVWLRSSGMGWKRIGRETHCSDRHARRLYEKGIDFLFEQFKCPQMS